ncbi:MAG: hypothetical protein NTY19_50840 [Planctomycetota bacterium]|nr:hypothetical protein [Planctomycetota bacterium]
MPTAQMNQKWWVANKAKTLSDTGDTVSKALQAWDAAKVRDDYGKIAKALDTLGKAATALKGKANKVLHKETIGYLQTYIDNCKEAADNLKKADGKVLLNSLLKLPKPLMDDLKSLDPQFWAMFEENVLFLRVMQGGKGSQKIYDEFIKTGSKHQVNLSSKQREAIDVAVKDGNWQGPPWVAAVDEITKLTKQKISSKEGRDACEKVENRMQLEGLRKL